METSNGQPYSWFDPETDSVHIPHRAVNGWLRITRWNGQATVVQVETVRLFGHLTANILYPPRPKGYPLYDDMFLGGRAECIPEAEALAWLAKHNLPLPAAVTAARQEADDAAHEVSDGEV